MPYRITLPFEMGDRLSTSDLGSVLHGNLYKWITAGDPSIGEDSHDQAGPKPFTLSPLTSPCGGLRFLHVVLLDDGLWTTLRTGLQSRPLLNVHGEEFTLAPTGMSKDYVSYNQLARGAVPGRHIDLQFVTPTCFRTGDLYYPLPEPKRLYRSWIERWERYAPKSLAMPGELLETVWEHVGLSACDIETTPVSLGYAERVGFLGSVRLCIVNAEQIDRRVRQQLQVLASYAEYCGSGIKTTHGMGQTRRVSWHRSGR